MKRMLLFLLMLAWATAGAQVFKRTGPDGKVYFSDQPGPDAVQIEVAPVQTISSPTLPAQSEAAESPDIATAYTQFGIVSPGSGQEIRANDGNVTVGMLLQPELRPGHRIKLSVDGEDGRIVNTTDSMTYQLTNLSRGLHTVAATVIDAEGNVLAKAGSVSFHVLRAASGGG